MAFAEPCSVEGCDRSQIAHGWCGAHLQRWYKFGDVQAEVPIGFRVVNSEAYRSKQKIRQRSRRMFANSGVCESCGSDHIVQRHHPDITDEMVIKLLCKSCHVRAHQEMPRGCNQYASRTHCSQGHLYDAANTIMRSDGARRCRTCNLAAQSRYSARKKERAAS